MCRAFNVVWRWHSCFMPTSVYDVARTQEMMLHLVLCLWVSDQLPNLFMHFEVIVYWKFHGWALRTSAFCCFIFPNHLAILFNWILVVTLWTGWGMPEGLEWNTTVVRGSHQFLLFLLCMGFCLLPQYRWSFFGRLLGIMPVLLSYLVIYALICLVLF
jgi:hypothetical protein